MWRCTAPTVSRIALASFLPQRDQKHHDADRRQNNGDGKAGARDLAAVMIIFFEMPGEAYQERKNANAEQNQPDRSLVIVEIFIAAAIKYSRQPKFKCAL
jgi:hypothetical protein